MFREAEHSSPYDSVIYSAIGMVKDFILFNEIAPNHKQGLGAAICNHFTGYKGDNDFIELWKVALGSIVFDGVRIAVWNFVFSTLVERKFW